MRGWWCSRNEQKVRVHEETQKEEGSLAKPCDPKGEGHR